MEIVIGIIIIYMLWDIQKLLVDIYNEVKK